MSDTIDEIMLETCRAIRKLGPRLEVFWRLCEIVDDLGPDELRAIVGSQGDTLSDKEVLRMLQEWNRGEKVIHERQ